MTRRLVLRSEHVTELSSAELEAVAGAAVPTLDCTGYCTSIHARCPTLGTCFLTGTTTTS